jgi:hypothetical protein
MLMHRNHGTCPVHWLPHQRLNAVRHAVARRLAQCHLLLLFAGREALLEEDVPDDEAAEELAPITAQLAYSHAELGRRDEAVAAYQVLA